MRVTIDHSKPRAEAVFRENRRFDLRDNKGRQIGIVMSVYPITMKPAEYGYELPHAGEWFSCFAHAARDGVTYGASNGSHFEPTLEAAKAWCESRAASTQKSYARKFG